MRKIVIMRGPPGTGKTTILKKAGMTDYAVSPDNMRRMIASPAMSRSGEWTIDQSVNTRAWAMSMDMLKSRLKRGETVAFDATLPTISEVRNIAELAETMDYEVMVVDRYGASLEATIERNLQRPETERVSKYAVERIFDQGNNTGEMNSSWKHVSTGEDIDASINAVREFLAEHDEIINLDGRYERIVHVGDLQGCLAPAIHSTSPISQYIDDPKTLFVFVGDLLDRGIENGALARWWINEMQPRDNVILVAGNHEDHLEIQARGDKAVSREFFKRTLPQLKEAGVSVEEMKNLVTSARTHFAYTFSGRQVLVNHPGFPRWPQPMWKMSLHQMRRGTGYYSDPVDKVWSDWAKSADADIEIWQVHGHRNKMMLPIHAASRSINLEGQVEFGGHLRFAILDSNGWTFTAIRNNVHRSMQEFQMLDKDEGRVKAIEGGAPIAPWAKDGACQPLSIDEDRFEAIRNDAMIHENPSQALEHVSALNFSKQAFWGKHWNAITTRTRGLFVDVIDRTIVARSYPKFFNHTERHDTSNDALQQNLAFPVVGYVKENGYLGITGYDKRTDQLIVASKSRIDGDFADWFREILKEELGEAGLERLLRFNRDQCASCVFEVIDPINDPHIIEESRRRVVLLDAIHRHEEFHALAYDDLIQLGKHLGCDVKSVAFSLPNWRGLEANLEKIGNDESWKPRGFSGPVEGLVIEDANGFMFKKKALFYDRWKRARSMKDRVIASRKSETKPLDRSRYEDDSVLLAFLDWCMLQSDEVLSRDIVELRNLWTQDPDQIIDGGAPEPVEKIPDQTGFLKGVSAIASQIASGKAKRDSVERLISRAEEDEHRLAAFNSHPDAHIIRSYVTA